MTDSYSNIQGELYTTFFGKYDMETTRKGLFNACIYNRINDVKYYVKYGGFISKPHIAYCFKARPNIDICKILYRMHFNIISLEEFSIYRWDALIPYCSYHPCAILYILSLCQLNDVSIANLMIYYKSIKKINYIIEYIIGTRVTYGRICDIYNRIDELIPPTLIQKQYVDSINLEEWLSDCKNKNTMKLQPESRPPTFKSAFKKEILKIMTPRLIYILPKDLVGDICKYV